jgi:hypothetical protein
MNIWTKREIEALTKMAKKNLSVGQMQTVLKSRSVEGIRCKLLSLGMPSRPNMIPEVDMDQLANLTEEVKKL